MGKLAGISELNYRERKVSEEYFSMREGGKISLLKVLEITITTAVIAALTLEYRMMIFGNFFPGL